MKTPAEDARCDEWIKAQLAKAPPMRPEQVARLSQLLFGNRGQR